MSQRGPDPDVAGPGPWVGGQDEDVEILLETPAGLRIERIVSRGNASPPGFWYDQDEAEWVLLISGAAVLALRDPDEVVELGPGDHLDIPPHRRHRVEWTSEHQPTVWIAVFRG